MDSVFLSSLKPEEGVNLNRLQRYTTIRINHSIYKSLTLFTGKRQWHGTW